MIDAKYIFIDCIQGISNPNCSAYFNQFLKFGIGGSISLEVGLKDFWMTYN